MFSRYTVILELCQPAFEAKLVEVTDQESDAEPDRRRYTLK